MKKSLSILLALVMVLSIFTVIPFSASAEEVDLSEVGYSIPSESDFISKLNSLKSKYPHGGTWSGTYYENGTPKASTCHGYACQMVYEVFGAQYYNDGFYNKTTYTMGNLNAGDLVRINSDSHSIFITKVTSDRIYFTDANGTGKYNEIRWDASYTVSEMRSKFSWKMHISGNNLTGTGSPPKPSNAWINASSSSIRVGESITFTFGATNAVSYGIGINKDGTRIITEGNISSGKSYTFYETGNYTAYVTCSGVNSYVDTETVSFVVYDYPGKSTITTFDLQNWSDGSFKLLNIAWSATSNTNYYEILFYDYYSGDCVKAINCGSSTSATLYYSDVPKGLYWVCIKSINDYGANWSESSLGEFVAPPVPTSGWIKASKDSVAVGEEITFTYGGENVTPVSNYWLTIKRDGEVVISENGNYYKDTGRTLTFDTPGTYTAYVNVNHNSGDVTSPEIAFTVRSAYPSAPSITEITTSNWGDNSFREMNISWTSTTNTSYYELRFYDFDTNELKKVFTYDNETLSAYISDMRIDAGHYNIRVFAVNASSGEDFKSETGSETQDVTINPAPVPTHAWVKVSKSVVMPGGEILFTFGGSNENGDTHFNYVLTIKRGDEIIFDDNANPYLENGMNMLFAEVGEYTVQSKAWRVSGEAVSDIVTFRVTNTMPSSVSLNTDDITITAGKTYPLTASVTPNDCYNVVTWRSSKPSVATVDENGLVTGVSEGVAIIYATTANGLSAPCVVQVEKGGVLGDVDGDGEISSNDATFFLRLLVEYDVPEKVTLNKMNGDVDGNKKLEAPDVTFLQRFIVGYSVPYPIGEYFSPAA